MPLKSGIIMYWIGVAGLVATQCLISRTVGDLNLSTEDMAQIMEGIAGTTEKLKILGSWAAPALTAMLIGATLCTACIFRDGMSQKNTRFHLSLMAAATLGISIFGGIHLTAVAFPLLWFIMLLLSPESAPATFE